jgi:hypothetical protein
LGEVIRELGALNKVISGRTDKEYYIDNKDKILDQRKDISKSISYYCLLLAIIASQ